MVTLDEPFKVNPSLESRLGVETDVCLALACSSTDRHESPSTWILESKGVLESQDADLETHVRNLLPKVFLVENVTVEIRICRWGLYSTAVHENNCETFN